MRLMCRPRLSIRVRGIRQLLLIRVFHMNRIQKFESTWGKAVHLAAENDMQLTNPSTGCYQLRHRERGWITNMYPRATKATPLLQQDTHRPGPDLFLPTHWTLLDVVEGAVAFESERASRMPNEVESSPDAEKPPLGIKPRRIHSTERGLDLVECIRRHIYAGKVPHEAWVNEIADIINELCGM